MIRSLYQYINKGSFRTLSFILAIALTCAFFFNLDQFSTQLRTANPLFVLFLFWGLVALWIHGIGFEIHRPFWQVVFFPYWGYLAFFIAVIAHFL